MCGLVGILGDNFSRNKELFEELLHVDQLRGPHSTGVAFLNEKYVQVIKDTVTPEELSYYKKYVKAMSKTDHVGLMGHNRQATRGKIVAENAHPFMHGRITLVHNGTTNHTTPLPKQFETDSEAICYAINEWGITKTWDKMEYCNPGTLIFWDAKDKSLNMITNGARPLLFSFLEDKAGIIWASEDWMYKGVCERNHVKLWKNDGGIETFYLEKDTHYSFKYDKKEKRISYTNTKIEFTKRSWEQTSYGNGYENIDWRARRGMAGQSGFCHTPVSQKMVGQKTGPAANGPLGRVNIEKFRKSLGGASKGIGMHDFYHKYNYCVGCDESLLDEYASCFILDDTNAFCSECINGFIALGVDPTSKLNVVN